jgi:hypothetical protein
VERNIKQIEIKTYKCWSKVKRSWRAGTRSTKGWEMEHSVRYTKVTNFLTNKLVEKKKTGEFFAAKIVSNRFYSHILTPVQDYC